MSKWVRRFHQAPEGEALLVCFPHAGGSAGAYLSLSAVLKDRVQTLAVQYPGRQDRIAETCAGDVDEIVDAVLQALEPYREDRRRIGLFGHSMGALPAFEAARRMEREGWQPAALFVSARQAPSLPWPPVGAPRLYDADERRVLDELELLGGSARELLADPEVMGFVLPALRADYRLLYKYEYRPDARLACSVVALAGASDPRVPVEGVRAWEEETCGPFACHVLPGGHFYLEGELARVAAVIEAALV
ncbi:thioesterase II family protein [Streptomyces sp. NPDC096132]|uniref:thioesterase II family protein n=1 Tax=Streptomyces sp. NPDC096132 TaxID=3366075 RepID=UPI0038153923